MNTSKTTKTKALFATTRTHLALAVAQNNPTIVIQKTQSAVATRDLGTVTINRKAKKS